MVDSNNGYLFGNAPDEEGNFPIKLNFKLTDLEAVTLQENLVVKNGKPTPSILIPRSLQLEQFTTFEIPFLVENTNGERVRFSSDFPTWFEIVSTNTNEFMLRGIPDESSVGTYVFKLSASTPAGLTDKSEISVTVNKNNSTIPLINDGELNTWSESWIGPIYLLESGWGYHAYLGWIYIQTNQFSGTWTWSEKWNWLWTSDQYWDGLEGNFFSKNLNQWIFVKVDQKKKRNLIYNYQSEKWYPY
jgi:hypothetical protein